MPFKTYTPSKTKQARDLAQQLQAAGRPVRPITVLNMLAARGISMNASQCSRAIAPFTTKRRRDACPVAQAPNFSGVFTRQPAEHSALLTALQFVRQSGGMHLARKTLDELAAFVNALGDAPKESDHSDFPAVREL